MTILSDEEQSLPKTSVAAQDGTGTSGRYSLRPRRKGPTGNNVARPEKKTEGNAKVKADPVGELVNYDESNAPTQKTGPPNFNGNAEVTTDPTEVQNPNPNPNRISLEDNATPQQHSSLEDARERLMRVVCFDNHGVCEVLKVREVEIPVLKDDEVLIKVAAAGVNPEDLWRRESELYCSGRATSPYIGAECSGEVIDIGANVHDRKIGDKVCAFLIGGGGYAEFVNATEIHTLPIPKGVSLIDAASLLQASSMVWHTLSSMHKATHGQKILIHGAGGGVGMIAIQYAKHLGCDVFVTSGKEKKLQLCKELGARVCINYKKEDFCKRVKAETGGKGVDVILDVAGKDGMKKKLDSLAIGGSLIYMGFKTGHLINLDLKVVRDKEITVLGSSLVSVDKKPLQAILNNVEKYIWPLIVGGQIIPVIGKAYKFCEAANAHKAMEEFTFAGKILLVP